MGVPELSSGWRELVEHPEGKRTAEPPEHCHTESGVFWLRIKNADRR